MLLSFLLALTLGFPTRADDLVRADDKKAKIQVPAEVTIVAGSPRAWAITAVSVVSERDGYHDDTLTGARMIEENVAAMRLFLEKQYKVKDHDQLEKRLDDLEKKGARADLEKLFKQAKALKLTDETVELLKDQPEIIKLRVFLKHGKRVAKEKEGMLAFDLVGFINLCRQGYMAGYLTEDEVWKRIDPVAKKLQKSYASWEDVGEIYSIGVEVLEEPQAVKTWAAFEKLKSGEKSPWKAIDWRLKLDGIAPVDVPAKKK